MRELEAKRRSRSRSKDAKRVLAWMEDEWGTRQGEYEMETCTIDGARSYIINGSVVSVERPEGLMLTLKGVMELSPRKRWVTVDMGAVRFLANGADVMAPGIVDADGSIEKGYLVWVRDERNHRPLCIGKALLSGEEMVRSGVGKAVKTLHFVGDPLWNVEI